MKYGFCLIILISFVIASCSHDKLNVDVSSIDLSLEFDRFEKELIAAKSPEEMKEINEDLIERGGELYEFYVYDMLRSGSVYEDSIEYYLWYFVSDTIIKEVHTDIAVAFEDFKPVEEELVDIFKHFKYHLPDAPLPQKVITYNSAFNYGVVSTDSVIGIGLDMYLGADNRVVKRVGFPLYMKEKMEAKYLPVDVAHSWLMTNVIGEERGETFLSNMIYFGKLHYALEALMPDLEEATILRYTQEEYDYSLASEYNIWQYLVDMNWIYSNDMKVKMHFFEEAPTTVGVEDSPGRLGRFMGWQMVRAYMEKNDDVTLSELLNEENETKILKAYKPKE